MDQPRNLDPSHEEQWDKCISLDSAVYRLTAIKKAAYKFGDRCYFQIERGENEQVKVFLRLKDPTQDISSLIGDYTIEVLDQELRESIADETDDLRNLIIAHAFSQTSLIEVEYETAPYTADPFQKLE
jgi:His-Xaa-Ser system protein HxsD